MRTRFLSSALFLFLALLALPGSSAWAQEATRHAPDPLLTRSWIRFGIGAGVADRDANRSLSVSLHHQRGRHLLSARGLLAAGPAESGTFWPDNTVGDAGALYGRAVSWTHGHASLSAGLAFTGVSTPQLPYGSDTRYTLGVPVEGRVSVAAPFLPYVGLSLSAYANLNAEESFGGLSLGLSLGDLR